MLIFTDVLPLIICVLMISPVMSSISSVTFSVEFTLNIPFEGFGEMLISALSFLTNEPSQAPVAFSATAIVTKPSENNSLSSPSRICQEHFSG